MAMPKIQLTDELIEKICSYVEQGNPFDYAFILSGICKASGYELRRAGTNDKTCSTQEYKLWSGMNEAKAKYCSRLVARMSRLIDLDDDKVDWKSVMTMLERRDPGNYRRDGARHENDAPVIEADDNCDNLVSQMAKLLQQVNNKELDSDEACKRAELLTKATHVKDGGDTRHAVEDIKDFISELDSKK